MPACGIPHTKFIIMSEIALLCTDKNNEKSMNIRLISVIRVLSIFSCLSKISRSC